MCIYTVSYTHLDVYKRQEKNSAIVESKPYCWSTIRTTLSESIPMFHCWPRRKLMEIGGFRCNADCSYCINARVMGMTQTEVSLTEISPQRIIEIAEKTGCSGLHFGINEVTAVSYTHLVTPKARTSSTVPVAL